MKVEVNDTNEMEVEYPLLTRSIKTGNIWYFTDSKTSVLLKLVENPYMRLLFEGMVEANEEIDFELVEILPPGVQVILENEGE